MNNNQFKNDNDFNVYYNLSISFNKYIERLSDTLCKDKSMNRSQLIRHLIYKEYQDYKKQLRIDNEEYQFGNVIPKDY